MVSIGLDTSDLPVDIDTTSQAPPSYDLATSKSTTIESPIAAPSTVSYYLPTDDADGAPDDSDAVRQSGATTHQSIATQSADMATQSNSTGTQSTNTQSTST